MKYRTLLWWLLLAPFLTACVGNDDNPPADPISKTPDFTVLGEDTANILHYAYSAATGQGTLINLTESFNVPRQFITLRQVNKLLTFYSFASGNFTALQFNSVTGDSKSYENFYANNPERSVIWGANSENKLFMGYYSPEGSSNLGVLIINPQASNTTELNIAFNTRGVFQPFYYDNRLIIPYLDAGDNYKAAILDPDAGVLLRTIDFGTAAPSILIDNAGDIVIFTGINNSTYGYTVYDSHTFDILSESEFSLNRFFSPGPLEANLIDGVLYYLNFYAQPSAVPFGPAVYDFEKDENRILDMIAIVQEVQEELQAPIILTAFGYHKEGNTFLVGYTKEGSTLFEGGILVISDQGKLLDNIPVPFVPIYIVQ